MDVELTTKQTLFYDAIFDAETGLVSTNNLFTEFASFGGFGSAKSFVVMFATLLMLLNYPDTKWLYARATYNQLEDSVIEQFLQAFPEEDYHYIYRKQKRRAIFENGSTLYFRAFDKDKKILSNQYHGASLCQAEEVPFELFLQIWGRLRLHTNGIPKNMMFLEGNPAAGWCKARYKDNLPYNNTPIAEPGSVFFMESTSYDNPYNPAGYISQMETRMPQTWVRRYIYGEWSNLDEMVLPEFSEAIHVIEPFEVPKYWKRANGLDYGFRTISAIPYGAQDFEGNIYIYDLFYETQQTPDLLAEGIKRHGDSIITAIDTNTKNPDHNGKTLFQELLKRRCRIIEASKNKDRNIAVTNMLFKQKKLFITRNCVKLIWELQNYKWKDMPMAADTDAKEEVRKKDDHAIDALFYLIAYLEDLKSFDPIEEEKKKLTMAYHLNKKVKGAQLKNLG